MMAAVIPSQGSTPPNIDTAPGAYPSTPSQTESPVIVSSHLSLSHAVHQRRAEYTRPRRVKVKVGTWNVASLSGTEKDIGAWFVDGKGISEAFSGIKLEEHGVTGAPEVESIEAQERRQSTKRSTVPINDTTILPGGDEIGIYALGLQEIVDISSAAEALRPFNDPNPTRKWKQAVTEALPKGYHRVAEQQLIGLYLLIYVSDAIHPSISSVSTTSVGTGLMGYMGNKGAVTTRLVLGETTRIVFVNCHLTAGVEKGNLDRRNWDAAQILSRTKFEPVHDMGAGFEESGESIGDEDFAFWFGDLNYRLEDMPPEDVRRLLMLHTKNEYKSGPEAGSSPHQKIEKELSKSRSSISSDTSDVSASGPTDDGISAQTAIEASTTRSAASSTMVADPGQDPSLDPTSLQATLLSLLPHDQLHNQMRTRKAFHDGWREGPIDFLPTYKYDVGSVGLFDSSEKRRGPSWCDRILYRTRRDRLEYENLQQEEAEAKRKDAEMKSRGVDEAAADEAVLFDYDPETDGADFDETNVPTKNPEIVVTRAGFEDRLHLDHYISHQRVLSSDHKPLEAIFTLDYDAVDLDLRAKVHQEVARELDKAENEGRPSVTIVVDQHRQPEIRADASTPVFEGVNFGDVRYDHPKVRTFAIANTGRVTAIVGFVDHIVEPGQAGGISPNWLSVHFDRPASNHNTNPGALPEYTLQPGDAANVELTLNVKDIDLVRRLNDNEATLEDVLVLRIQNGRDYFLPIRGHWLQSIFGRSIDKLVRIPEGGVRKLQHQRPDSSSHGEAGDDNNGVKWSAPRELFRLTEAIESLLERAVGEWEMTGRDRKDLGGEMIGWPFISSVNGADAEQQALLQQGIRESLDTDAPFFTTTTMLPADLESTTPLQRLEAVAETLVHFLYGLEDGVITTDLWTALESDYLAREKSKSHHLSPDEERTWILDTLSSAANAAHSVAFTFITFTLARVANEIAPLRSHHSDGGHAAEVPPTSPGKSIRDSGGEQSQNEGEQSARRRKVEGAFAKIFGEAMVRLPESSHGAGNAKARKASEVRRARIVEVFLRES